MARELTSVQKIRQTTGRIAYEFALDEAGIARIKTLSRRGIS